LRPYLTNPKHDDALTVAEWTDYRSMLRLVITEAGIKDPKGVPVDGRLVCARDAFDMVLGRLSSRRPFRPVLHPFPRLSARHAATPA
jgi:hypothetical protein